MMTEKTEFDAPGHYNAPEAEAWAAGHNACLAELPQTLQEPPLAKLIKEVDPGLAEILTDNAAWVRVIRGNVIKECMAAIDSMRSSEAGLFDAKHSGQRGCDRSDALYDAYHRLRALSDARPDRDVGLPTHEDVRGILSDTSQDRAVGTFVDVGSPKQ